MNYRKLLLLILVVFSTITKSIAGDKLKITRPLQIAVYNAPPFGMQERDSSYSGLMVSIWEDIAEELDWSYEYTLTDMNTLLMGIQNKRFDVGLGAISITPKREKLVDFTQPVNPSGTGIAVAAQSRKMLFRSYWKPILISLFKLIGLLLLVLLFSGTIVWWVESKQTKEPSPRNISNIADAFWWSAVTMTTVGYGDKVPTSKLGKVLGIVWIFTSIIVLSLFTANASAIFTAAKLESPIQTLNDLRNSQVGTAEKSSGQEYLKREGIEHINFDNINLAVEAMLKGEIDCVVSNVPVLQYLNNKVYYQQMEVVPNWLIKNNMGIALQEDSPLKELIDQVLLKKIAEPYWQARVYQYLGVEN